MRVIGAKIVAEFVSRQARGDIGIRIDGLASKDLDDTVAADGVAEIRKTFLTVLVDPGDARGAATRAAAAGAARSAPRKQGGKGAFDRAVVRLPVSSENIQIGAVGRHVS